MRTYSIFGGRLRSELEFPDLSLATADGADWEFRMVPELAIRSDERPLGAHQLGAYRGLLFEGPDHLRLTIEGLGDCLIAAGGRTLLWRDGGRASPELLRLVVLGPVMALALQQAGILCLHASAVAIDGQCIGFVAPKGGGKSTLAMALVQAGARLVTDDALALDLASVPMARPGVHSVRLRDDALAELAAGPVAATILDGAKKTLVGLPRESLVWEAAPLAAIYALTPFRSTATRSGTWREPLAPVDGALRLAMHGKLADPLIGAAAVGARLRSIAAVVCRVPVYALHVPRDLRVVVDVADRLLAWHVDCPRGRAKRADTAD